MVSRNKGSRITLALGVTVGSGAGLLEQLGKAV